MLHDNEETGYGQQQQQQQHHGLDVDSGDMSYGGQNTTQQQPSTMDQQGGVNQSGYQSTRGLVRKDLEATLVAIDTMGGDLLLIAISSVIVFIQGATICAFDTTCSTATSDWDIATSKYAVAAGTISAILCFLLIILMKITTLPGRPRVFMAGFLAVWWTVAVGILTFAGPNEFQTVSNGYFCTWACFLLSGKMVHKEVEQFRNAFGKIQGRFKGSGERARILYLCMLANLIVLFSALNPCLIECNGVNGFAVGMGGASFFVCLLLHVLESKVHSFTGKIAAFLTLFWGITVAILTFEGPFLTVGNGYFASFGSLIGMGLLMNHSK